MHSGALLILFGFVCKNTYGTAKVKMTDGRNVNKLSDEKSLM